MNVYKKLLLVVFTVSQFSGQALSNPFSKRAGCEDESIWCEDFAKDGDCENDKDFMEEFCEKTCGWCGEGVVNPTGGDCKDEDEYCDEWAKDGDCEDDKRFMRRHCKKSCGWCEGETEDPCSSYKVLQDAESRLTSKGRGLKCDDQIEQAWYRLTVNGTDAQIPSRCVREKRCGTFAPGWLKGRHPTESQGIVKRRVCFNWEGRGCCEWSKMIQVKNCGDFYVYNLKKTPECYLRYCAELPGSKPTGEPVVKPTEEKPTEEPVVKPSEEPSSLKCGVRWNEEDKRIVGGLVAASNQEWPWQAGLKETRDDKIFCGGTLINNRWILTAAHCIEDITKPRKACAKENANKVKVVLGEFDQENVDGHEVDKDVSHLCMHSKYDKRTTDYDIALLRLESPVKKFNATMSPVCLPTSSTDFPPGTKCTTTGFGTTAEGGEISNELRQVTLPLRALQYCERKYSGEYTVTDRMLCAGDRGGKDSCQGDSGGPLVCKDEQSDRFVLWGVVSWGKGCARKGNPGLYADVKYFLPWIEATMKSVP